MTDKERIILVVPDDFVVPRPKPPEPPPFPGTVSVEDIRPPADPPLPFLVPWAAFHDAPRELRPGYAIPVDINRTMLAKYLDRHEVRHTVEEVFKDRGDAAASLVEDVLNSLQDPFRGSTSLVWQFAPTVQPNPNIDDKLGGKKLKNRHKILKGQPWTIASFADTETGVLRRNMIYDGDGDAIVQVDFGHGNSVGIHCHALVKGNLEHSAVTDENHLFRMHDVPWMWLAAPWGESRESKPVIDAARQLPATCDDVTWVAVSIAYEDFMGEMERTNSSA